MHESTNKAPPTKYPNNKINSLSRKPKHSVGCGCWSKLFNSSISICLSNFNLIGGWMPGSWKLRSLGDTHRYATTIELSHCPSILVLSQNWIFIGVSTTYSGSSSLIIIIRIRPLIGYLFGLSPVRFNSNSVQYLCGFVFMSCFRNRWIWSVPITVFNIIECVCISMNCLILNPNYYHPVYSIAPTKVNHTFSRTSVMCDTGEAFTGIAQ